MLLVIGAVVVIGGCFRSTKVWVMDAHGVVVTTMGCEESGAVFSPSSSVCSDAGHRQLAAAFCLKAENISRPECSTAVIDRAPVPALYAPVRRGTTSTPAYPGRFSPTEYQDRNWH